MVLPPQDASTPTIPEPKSLGPVEIDELKRTRLFQEVPDDAMDQIKNSCEIVELRAGESLVTSRQGIEYLYIIREGYVSIWMPPSFYPKLKKVYLAWRGPGQIIGELRKKGDEPSNTSITTYERCELIQIRLDTFRDLAESLSLLYENVAYMVLDKMRHEGRRSEVVQMNPALRQVAQTLINLAEDRCANFSFTQLIHSIPGIIHQDELAGYAGITRKSVNKELNELERRGLIFNEVRKGSRITIRHLHELQKLISSEILDTKLRELETTYSSSHE